MTLKLIRHEYREDGIFSELRTEKNKVLAQTCEHSYNKLPKIPFGTYTCRRGLHKLHVDSKAFETFEVCGVKGHTGILFHIGNWQSESNGCILVGGGIAASIKGQMVTGSKQAFKDLMEYLKAVDQFELVVSE